MSQNISVLNSNVNPCDKTEENNRKNNTEIVTVVVKEKKVRRAFSMPRNPFRLSSRRSSKTNKDSDLVMNNILSSKDSNNFDSNQLQSTTTTTITPQTPTLIVDLTDAIKDTNINHQGRIAAVELGDGDGGGSSNKNRLFRRSSWKKFLSRIAQQMTSINIGAKNSSTLNANTDRVPPLGGYVWPPDQIPGVTGLKNHGNTCFMNAVLQCLSHTDILAEYFVLDQYKADLKRRNKLTSRKFGTKGELTEQLALVLKALWTCKIESDYSTSFKAVVDRYGSQFRSSTQHDAQEFLFWLLDKVHEDLNTASKRKYKSIKNSYGRPDEVIAAETLANHIRCNNSFVQAVFQAQFRSSLSCPRCHKQSNTFDPFHCISVQLPQLSQQAVFVTVLYATQHPRQVKLGLAVPSGSPIIALREQLQADTGIPLERIVLTEITNAGFTRVFCDSHPMSSVSEDDSIYCIETLETTEANANLTLIVANIHRTNSEKDENIVNKRFGTPFCVQVSRDVSYVELQKKLLKEMQTSLKSEIFAYSTPPSEMFKIRLQDPSADPDTYIEPTVEHPLFTEMIDLALSVLPADVGPSHVKLLLEWTEPEKYFSDLTDPSVEHESVSQLKAKFLGNSTLTLEQCLEHYTKAETLSAEDAWRCPNCQKYLPVVKTLGLWSLPDILVVHFKRFRQQHIKGPQSAKLTTTVKFPLYGFDMTPHMARDSNINNMNGGNNSEDNWSPWRKVKKRENCMQPKDNRYDLYAVCYHQGDTLETGHYTAACKNPYDHQWYKFDDQKVNQVPPENIPDDIVNNEAYILFYQRRKVDNVECSGTSSTSGDHWVSKIAVAPSTNNSSARASAATLNVNVDDKKEATAAPAPTISVNIDDGNDTAIVKPQLETITLLSNSICSNDSIKPEEVGKKIEVNVEINTNNEKEKKLLNNLPDKLLKIEKTNEDEIVDVEGMEDEEELNLYDVEKVQATVEVNEESVPIKVPEQQKNNIEPTDHKNEIADELQDIQLRNESNLNNHRDNLSTSVPTQRSLWPTNDSILTASSINRGSLNFSDMINSQHIRNQRHRDANEFTIRHSMSTSSAMLRQQKENEAIAMLRGSGSCSKDTLLFIDQQNHSFVDDENSYLGNRSLWISPVTPHKLITVSPKN